MGIIEHITLNHSGGGFGRVQEDAEDWSLSPILMLENDVYKIDDVNPVFYHMALVSRKRSVRS